jgi:hypothetical protein
MPVHNGSLVIGIKHKAQENFLHGCHVVLHSTRNNAFKKVHTSFQGTKVKYCSHVTNGLKFAKFLENWSDGSKVGVGDSMHVCVCVCVCARAHTHTHCITSC